MVGICVNVFIFGVFSLLSWLSKSFIFADKLVKDNIL